MYIVFAIFLFGVLIAIHELGHFISAKSLGVRVNEFSIGMGPAIFKRKKGETQYSLRVLPIGGFCAMEGEDSETEDPRGLSNQPAWKTFIILAAGSAMNFLLGLILIILVYSGAEGFTPPVITSFMENCPYEGEEALMEGDRIYKIDGHRIFFTSNISTYLQYGGDEHDIVVIRDGKKHEINDFKIVPVEYAEGTFYGFKFESRETGFWAHIKYPLYTSVDFIRDVWRALRDLIGGAVGLDMMAGPVGIVSMINDMGQDSATVKIAVQNILYFGAFISINLAVMNLLPIPALDGGRILFLAVNGLAQLILRKKINNNYEKYIHAAGMILLLGLMAFVMYNDIVRIIT